MALFDLYKRMKYFVMPTICLTAVNLSNAQFYENNGIYLSSEINTGSYNVGVDFNVNYVYKEKYSLKLGCSGFLKKPKSTPEDYIPGVEKILSFWLSGPFDEMMNYQVGFGRVYKLNDAGTFRANISLGFGYSEFRNVVTWQKRNVFLFTRNYDVNYESYSSGSLIINPKIEFPVVSFYGLTVSPLLMISKKQTYLGIGVGQMIGIIRKKKIINH